MVENRVRGTVTPLEVEDANVNISLFRFDQSLRPGLSMFRVLVVDAEGFDSTSEHFVLYERPFFRSPWLYLLEKSSISFTIPSKLSPLDRITLTISY